METRLIFATAQLYAVLALLLFLYRATLDYIGSDISGMQRDFICLGKNTSLTVFPNGDLRHPFDYINGTFRERDLYGANVSFTFCSNWSRMNQCANYTTIKS